MILLVAIRIATIQRALVTPLEASFARALLGFNPFLHQPPPPAYPVYVALGKLVNFFVHDARMSLLILSIAGSIATFAFLARAFPTWTGLLVAFAVALVPLPARALPDTVAIAFFAGVIWSRSRSDFTAAALQSAATIGVLPQSIVVVVPFMLAVERRAKAGAVFVIALFVAFLQTMQNIELRRMRAFVEANTDWMNLFDRPAMWVIALGAVTYHLFRGKAHDLAHRADVQRGVEH